MPQYHLFVECKDNSKGGIIWDIHEERILNEVVTPFKENRPFLFSNSVIYPIEVKRLEIICSNVDFTDLVLPNQCYIFQIQGVDYIFESIFSGRVKDAYICTEKFLNRHKRHNCSKSMVFIVHGSQKEPALELQKHLTKEGVDAKIFDDLKEQKTGNTIIELLEFIWGNVGYAFIVATPDDLGCFKAEIQRFERSALIKDSFSRQDMDNVLSHFQARARQNVVFEYGLFIGALGRDRVCCLLNKDTTERPSDIDGILYVTFKESIKETFEEVNSKLKAPDIGLIKS